MLQNLLKITLIVLCLVSQAYAQGVTPVKPVVGSTWIIGDGSGPLTVDGTVAATQSGTWNITNVSGTVSLPTGAATAANQDGIIKDGAGDTTQANVSSGSLHVACQSGCSGGTQYTEDAAAASDPVGTANILIRADTPGAVASTNGDNVAQRGTNYGAAFVQVVDSSGNFINTFGGSGGTSSNFGSAVPSAGTAVGFTDGTNMVMGRVVTSAPSAGDAGLVVRNISATTIATGSAVPASASFIAGTDGTNARALKTDTGGELQVDVLSLPAIPTGSNTIGALVANQSVNVAQINGVTPLMGAGNTGTGSPRVTIATDQAALPGMGVYVEDAAETAGGNLAMAGSVRRDAAASSAGTTGDNATINTDALGLLWTRGLDPCSGVAKQYLPINISTATTTEITASLAGASNHYYVCSINIGPVAGAQNLALVDDDSDGCGSVTSGLAGGTSAGTGWNIAANGGLTIGNGLGSIARTGGTNRVLCLVSSAAVQTSGVITVVAAP